MSEDVVSPDVLLPISFCQIFGRMEDETLKGVDIAIEAMDKCYDLLPKPKSVLVIRGLLKGTADKFLREKRSTLKSGLQIRPREYDADLNTLKEDLKNSSLILMPSRTEGFGLVALEAISIGCPVLLSNQSGIAELITEVAPNEADKWIVPVDTTDYVDRWAKEIEYILRDREAARNRMLSLRSALEAKISWGQSVKALLDIIHKWHYQPVDV
jgi:glycosyltransferase involved in cell wall biosynthesis